MENAKELVDALLEHGSKNAMVATWGLTDLVQRLKVVTNRAPLFELGAHKAVASVMGAHALTDAKIAELCCDAVEEICLKPEHQVPTFELGVGKLVIQTLTAHPENVAVATSAFGAAWNLSMEPAQADALMEIGLVEALVNATKKHSGNYVAAFRGFGAMNRLTGSESARVKMLELGTVELVVDAMKTHTLARLELEKWGVHVLWGMLSSTQHIPAVMKLGAAQAVVDAMKTHAKTNDSVARAGCGFLACVARFGDDDHRTALMNAGACTALVSAMVGFAETNMYVAHSGCVAVYELSRVSENASSLLDAGAGEVVLSALTAWNKKNKDVAKGGTDALVRFAADKNHRARLLMMGAGKFLMRRETKTALKTLMDVGQDPPLSALECSVCKERTEKYALEKCGHVFCSRCADVAIEKKACHNCRKDGAKKIRLFL